MDEDQLSNPDGGASRDESRDRPQREQITTDESHRLLTSPRRRLLLSYLSTRSDGSVSLDELIDIIAERECPDPGPATHRERILIDLHHVHLPRLADAGVLDYDPVAETVRYNGSETLESFLDTSDTAERRTE